jgi:hypothetical protein
MRETSGRLEQIRQMCRRLRARTRMTQDFKAEQGEPHNPRVAGTNLGPAMYPFTSGRHSGRGSESLRRSRIVP